MNIFLIKGTDIAMLVKLGRIQFEQGAPSLESDYCHKLDWAQS